MTIYKKTKVRAHREIDDIRNTIEVLMNVPNISLHIIGFSVTEFSMRDLKNANVHSLRF